MMKNWLRVGATLLVVIAAAAVVAYKYWIYVTNPWTRDGQVRAQVVQITPRVSGPITQLPIEDNRLVSTGDLLFEIDPRTFEASLDQAHAELDRTRDDIKALQKQVEAAEATVQEYDALIKQAEASSRQAEAQMEDADATFRRVQQAGDAVSVEQLDNARADYNVKVAAKDQADAKLIETKASKLQSEADLAQAEANLGAPGDQNARLRVAQAAVRTAELDLEFTKVSAPVDGYVTNLNLRLGDQAVENQPALALVDINSFWVTGFFKETVIRGIGAGDRAIVTLMSYPDQPLEGTVDSVGWGIAQEDGSTGFELLPTVNPTFEWIRLAQRVPVRVHLSDLPEDVHLRVGTSASVLVMTDSPGTDSGSAAVAAPQLLQ
ncbi:MAG: HlyD family secretion protein [Pseudomonadota bacterium]